MGVIDFGKFAFGASAPEGAVDFGRYDFGKHGGSLPMVTVSAPYIRRVTAAGAAIRSGNARITAIKGNSVVWNQALTWRTASQTVGGVTAIYDEQGVVLNGTATENAAFYNAIEATISAGHKYVGVCTPVSGVTLSVTGLGAMPFAALNSTDRTGSIGYFSVASGTVLNNVRIHASLIDLTMMFGAGREPSTVAEFKALFPATYYPYNAGQLLSLTADGIVTDGFNQFNEATAIRGKRIGSNGSLSDDATFACSDFIPVFAGTDYYFCGLPNLAAYVGFLWYDEDKRVISYGGKRASDTTDHNLQTLATSPANAAYVRLNTKIANLGVSTCVNLSWSGYRDGEYEPHWQQTKALPLTTLTSGGTPIFPDGMRSAGSVHDEITAINGMLARATKRIGVVDLGTLTWTAETAHNLFSAHVADAGGGAAQVLYWINAKYPYVGAYNVLQDKQCGYIYYNYFAVKDSAYPLTSAGAAQLKSALSGVMAFYVLATPVEYDLDTPIPCNYLVSDFGTETATPQGMDGQGVPKTAPLAADINYLQKSL